MATIKTAISIEKPIFDRADALARELNISRSRLFATAVREFLERYQNKKLFQAINDAHDDFSEPEAAITEKMKSRHMEMVKDQW